MHQNNPINRLANNQIHNQNNNYLLNNNSLNQNISGDFYQDYFKNKMILDSKNNKMYKNSEISYINNNRGMNIGSSINNVNNSYEQSRFSNLFNNNFNNNLNLNPSENLFLNNNDSKTFNNMNLNNISFPSNFNNNIYDNFCINNNISQKLSFNQNLNQIINLKTETSNDINNIITKQSLTDLLCNKKGINEINNLLKNQQYNIDFIRKMILILKEENGLHIVFKNVYGNYFIQELFQKMNNDLIQLTIDLISSEFVNIAKSPCGTHCLQKLLNFINNSEMEIAIIKVVKYKEKEMAFDDNATYVLQKIISIIPEKKRIRLNNIIIENIKDLSINANSVFVLKKFISSCTIEENRNKVIEGIKKYFMTIAQNPYGNYVIQYFFEVWPIKSYEIIINEIIDKVIDLSKQKYSSNIIAKALEFFNFNYRQKLINSLCFSPNILCLLKNKFSYYVINKAIKYMDNDSKTKFEHFLKRKMNDYTYKEKLLINQIISRLKNE